METIIFFSLVIPIFGFVLYLGATAIMKGFSAKNAMKSNESVEDENMNLSNENNKLSDELNKLNELYQSGALSKEEFEKAKNKLLND